MAVSFTKASAHLCKSAGPLDAAFSFESLTVLNMTANAVTSLSPALPQSLPALLQLVLDSCYLDGTLPNGELWMSLICAHIAETLHSLLPSSNFRDAAEWGAGWPQLELMKLDHNPSLRGTLPESYSSWQSLEHFSASGSGLLEGTLPVSWATRWVSLQMLDLSFNNLTGVLPPSWASANLSFLSLAINYFQVTWSQNGPSLACKAAGRQQPCQLGAIFVMHGKEVAQPVAVCCLPQMCFALALAKHAFTFFKCRLRCPPQRLQGTIPDWAEQVPVLSILNLRNNNLTGRCSAVTAPSGSRAT